MSISNHSLPLDVAIIGGGIAGLWMLAQLRGCGYSAVLIEQDRLGAGQTICAQGIIHGGTKYALRGRLGEAAKTVAAMPEQWQQALHGKGKVDLRGATRLAEHQYLWSTPSFGSQLVAFFASRLLHGRMAKILAHQAGTSGYPPAFRHPAFRGTVYQLAEPVIEVASVLAVLARRHHEALVLCQESPVLTAEGEILLRQAGRSPLMLRPAYTLFAAGASNPPLSWAEMQLRPLHMVLARGPGLPGPLYAHCVGLGEAPRLTVTSHTDAAGRLIWYLGGNLAEQGVHRDRATQIRAARRELASLFPWVDWAPVEFATFTIQRAEARQANGQRPSGPNVLHNGHILVAWPTKLALAPLLADQVERLIATLGLAATSADLSLLADWPKPEIAIYPWDREDLLWS